MDGLSVTTPNGSVFTEQQARALARLIYARFGEDGGAATRAWQRLLENNCTERGFMALVDGATTAVNDTTPLALNDRDMHSIAYKELRKSALGERLAKKSKAKALHALYTISQADLAAAKKVNLDEADLFTILQHSLYDHYIEAEQFIAALTPRYSYIPTSTLHLMLADYQVQFEHELLNAALLETSEFTEEIMPGMTTQDILDYTMFAVEGRPDTPSWVWIKENACLAYNSTDAHDDFADGYVVNADDLSSPIPEELLPVFQEANKQDCAYIRFTRSDAVPF